MMVRVLLLDTLGSYVRMALLCAEDGLSAKKISSVERSTPCVTQGLLVMIEEILTQEACSLKEITALAVLTGPGSFTSLRGLLITAQGLHFTHPKLRLYACSRFLPLAHYAEQYNETITTTTTTTTTTITTRVKAEGFRSRIGAGNENVLVSKEMTGAKENVQFTLVMLRSSGGRSYVRYYCVMPLTKEKSLPSRRFVALGEAEEWSDEHLHTKALRTRLTELWGNAEGDASGPEKKDGERTEKNLTNARITVIGDVLTEELINAVKKNFSQEFLVQIVALASTACPSLVMVQAFFIEEILQEILVTHGRDRGEDTKESTIYGDDTSLLRSDYRTLRPLYIRRGYSTSVYL